MGPDGVTLSALPKNRHNQGQRSVQVELGPFSAGLVVASGSSSSDDAGRATYQYMSMRRRWYGAPPSSPHRRTSTPQVSVRMTFLDHP